MFFRGQPQTTTTVHIHQAPPQQVQTGQPTAGQPVVCVQPVMGQSVVGGYGHNNGYGVQSFSVVAPVVRRNRASVSCCGHTTVWTMLSIGILMLVTGSILMGIFSNQDVRSDRITAYNEYVEKWGAFIEEEKYSEPEFSVLSSLYCKPNYTTSEFDLVGQERRITLKLETDKTDELEDSKGGSPKPLPLEPQHKWQKDNVNVQDVTAELCYLHDYFQWRDSSTNDYTDIYTVKSRFKETRSYKCDDCAHKCYNKNYGHVYSGRCYYPMVIDGVCLKVKRTYASVGGALSYEADTSEPAVGNEGESQGCFYSRNSKSFRPNHFNNEPEPVHSQDFKIQYTVRYSKDAWLGYMRVTENSGYFGDTNEAGVSIMSTIFRICRREMRQWMVD